jgi:hypothetical protein
MRIPAKPVRKEAEDRETVPHCALDARSLHRVSKAIVMMRQRLRPKNPDLNSSFVFFLMGGRGHPKIENNFKAEMQRNEWLGQNREKPASRKQAPRRCGSPPPSPRGSCREKRKAIITVSRFLPAEGKE